MTVEVFNRQRRFPVDAERLASIAAATLAAVGFGERDLTLVLSNDRSLRALNRDYRGKDKATDVLSFPYEDAFGPVGDVIISVERAAAQAAERGHELGRELDVLALHGALHVCGYDHETDDGTMDRLERRLRKRLLR